MLDIYYAKYSSHIRAAGRAVTHLVVLIRCHGHELGLGEHVGPEGAVGELQDVVGPNYVEPGLILVHGIQDGLEKNAHKSEVSISRFFRCLRSIRSCWNI